MEAGADPLVATLRMDARSFRFFEDLRQQHYPPAANRVPAHISLFHHLPGDRVPELFSQLSAVCENHAALPILATHVRMLGRGVAIELASQELSMFHALLAKTWASWLTPQDRQRFRAHVTIQNKASPADAGHLFQELDASFSSFPILGEGVDLWVYRRGPWEPLHFFPFSAI